MSEKDCQGYVVVFDNQGRELRRFKRYKHPGGYSVTFWSEIVKKMDVVTAHTSWRVFAYIVSKVSIGSGEARVSSKEIEQALKLKQPAVSKALKDLVDHEMVFRKSKGVYVPDPTITWAGKEGQRQKALEEIHELTARFMED